MDTREMGHKVIRISQLRRWHTSLRLKDLEDVYYGQLHLLDYIAAHPGCTQKELADQFALSKATITKSVRVMMKNELVSRKVHAGDERRYELYPTGKGRQINDQAQQILRQVDEQTFSGFSEEELRQFDSFQDRIMNNLETDYSRNKTMRQLMAQAHGERKKP